MSSEDLTLNMLSVDSFKYIYDFLKSRLVLLINYCTTTAQALDFLFLVLYVFGCRLKISLCCFRYIFPISLKILFVCIIISVTSFPLSAALTAPYVGIHAAVGGVNYLPFKDRYFNSSNEPTSEFSTRAMIDVMLGKKVFFYGKFGYGNFSEGALGLGVGWYIFDKRVNGVGPSLTTILSLTGVLSFLNNDTYDNYRSSGGELSVFYNFSVYKHLTFRVGGYFGVDALSIASQKEIDGIGISYGILLGIAI